MGICVNKTTIGGLINKRNIWHIQDQIASEPEINGKSKKTVPDNSIYLGHILAIG